MTKIWGIHNDQNLDLVRLGVVSIGWSEVGDLSAHSVDRDFLKDLLSKKFPEAKAGAIPVWAGVLLRFFNEIQIGDLVVSPDKSSRTINIGRVSSAHYFDAAADVHPNRRRVEWIKTDIPRSNLPAAALNELGSAITLFEIRRHKAVIEQLVVGQSAPEPEPDQDVSTVEDEPNAQRVESYSRDFVETALRQMDPTDFERFVAGVMQAMGYRADVTQASGDGGVDVIASRDPLRLQPPVIKVQVKRTASVIGGPQVQALIGTLAPGGSEVALFVTLGNYSNDAVHIARTRQDLRLLTGREFIDLVFQYYGMLDSEWQRLIPLRTVLAVDRNI